jgi:hypothetical protein
LFAVEDIKLSVTLTILITAVTLVVGAAQTLPAPAVAVVEREDANVRVIRMRLAPNQSVAMHEEPARVVIALTSNDLVITSPDGTTKKVDFPLGHFSWSDTGKFAAQNSGTELENIVVELKKANAPGKSVAGPPLPKPAGYLDEPHHHWLFENQYVRVYDVRIPAGETTLFHLHALDTVAVHLTPGLVSRQNEGGEWTKPGTVEANEVELTHDSKQPRTHRVRNLGNDEIRVLMVQILAMS